MMNQNQPTSETAVANNLEDFQFEKIERDNYFEPVKLNLPEYEEADDPNISSLFGDQDFNTISPFIYEQKLTNQSKLNKFANAFNKFDSKKIFNKSTKKIAVGAVAAVTLIGIFTVGNSLLDFDNSFVADASPLVKIENQNILSKTEALKTQIASGDLYNENYTVTYKLTEDDTISRVAEKTSIPPEAIKLMNSIIDDKDLAGKESIVIPTKSGIVHKIASRETLGSIAQKYRVSVKEIIDMNKGNIKNPNYLKLDQILFIPFAGNNKKSFSETVKAYREGKIKNNLETNKPKIKVSDNSTSRENNIVHKLASGETFESLTKKYKVSMAKLVDSNPKVDPSRLQINQAVIIPVNPLNRSGSRNNRSIRIASRSLMAGVDRNGNLSSGRFVWPAKGEFSSPFGHRGYSFHKGIDVAAVVGTPIYAAMQGQVIYTGWESGYGETVEIKHPNGLVTRYAHCSHIFVHVGQNVETSQHIAAIGMTGHVTGPHVHFEVLLNGVQVNPRNYL